MSSLAWRAAGRIRFPCGRKSCSTPKPRGLSLPGGDRLVEIGCVELVNRVMTGRTCHAYINPQRPMPIEAFERPRPVGTLPLGQAAVRGRGRGSCWNSSATARWSRTTPDFDFGFINGELTRCGRPIVDVAAWSTRWRSPASSIPAPSIRLTRSAPATASTSPSARCTAR